MHGGGRQHCAAHQAVERLGWLGPFRPRSAAASRLFLRGRGDDQIEAHVLPLRRSAFSAGTVLALAAFPNTGANGGGTDRPQDSERRNQAKKDLSSLIEALKEIGTTWTTALTSAGVLDGKRDASLPRRAMMIRTDRPSSAFPLPSTLLSHHDRMPGE